MIRLSNICLNISASSVTEEPPPLLEDDSLNCSLISFILSAADFCFWFALVLESVFLSSSFFLSSSKASCWSSLTPSFLESSNFKSIGFFSFSLSFFKASSSLESSLNLSFNSFCFSGLFSFLFFLD